MKRKTLKFFAAMAVAAVTFAASAIPASAQPIQLFTDQISKLKFVNYENVFDVNGNSIIDIGDKFEGILNTEAITNISGSQDLSVQLGTNELTGYFKFTVIGTSGAPQPIIGPPLGAAHLDFGLLAGDSISLYVGTGATKNWDPASASAVTFATDGVPWASILPGPGPVGIPPGPGVSYEGISDTVVDPILFPTGFTFNKNWADVSVNSTGYSFLPTLWPDSIPAFPLHTYLGFPHGGHVSDVFFTSHVTSNLPIPPGVPGWLYRSEDPLYVNVVPEPSTFLLLGAGLLGMGGMAARRRFKK